MRTPYKNEIAILLNNVADIIDRYKQTIDEKETMRIEAVKANESKSRFLATMSHEIRTPMNAVIGISEMELMRDDLPKDIASALGKIRNSGHTLLSIINDILDLSKIETGKLELLPMEYDLPSLINDTVQLNIIRIGSKPVEFALEVEPSVPALLFGDGLRIKQILNNILSNAFKYTERGKVTLAVSSEPGGENEIILIFRVSDTGQGMRKEDVSRLFDEYSRFNLDANRKTEGTGLGMAITQKLTAVMNGSITVESEYGKGSVFTVSLPQRTIENAEIIGAELAERLRNFTFSDESLDRKFQFQREYMPYGSVLIIDDMETNLFVAQGLMAPYGLKIEIATSGFAALDKVRAGKVYDVIFLDHMMPDMDGIETIHRLRKLGYKAPIIALTANATTGNDKMFLEHGFDDFISKPIDLRQLDAALNTHVRRRHAEDAKRLHGGVSTMETAKLNEMAEPVMKQVITRKIVRLEIEGVDTERGLAMTGGSEKQYREVLALYCKDASGRAELLRAMPGETDPALFTMQFHALKSASASIGAAVLSDEAARLEAAGKNGDLAFIRKRLADFCKNLELLTERVQSALQAGEENGRMTNTTAIPGGELTAERLMRLKKALGAENVGETDKLLKELTTTQNAKANKILEAISEHVLISEFAEAVRLADSLLREIQDDNV
jgi:CheY-like chemotaxis protein/nitrogen-specific signal transduction histidine kinase